MKNNIWKLVAIFILLILVFALPVTRAEIHWMWASLRDEVSSYESYLNTWPNRRHYALALSYYDTLSWQEAEAENTVPAYQRYIKNNKEGANIAKAEDRIDDLRWQASVSADSIDDYLKYMQLHRDGKYYTEAFEIVETLRWEEALSTNSVEAYEKYLGIYNDGKYANEAAENIDLLHFQNAASDDTIKAYHKYIKKYPEGIYIEKAEERIAELLKDNTVFETALQKDTEEAIEAFLEEYPGHQKELAAQRALEDIIIRNAYERALKSRTILAMSSFIKDYPSSHYVGDLLNEIWNYLMEEHPPDIFTCSTNLNSFKSALPRAITGERCYAIAFAPREVEGDGIWSWLTQFYELAGQACSIETMSPYITKPNGEIWGWTTPAPHWINSVDLEPYGKGSYRWSCEGSFTGSSVTLDYSVLKSYTKLISNKTD